MLCRSLADIEAAAYEDWRTQEPVRSQEWADRKTAILAPHMPAIEAARGAAQAA